MENASKALIIAGSILVSIVLISLGVMVVSNVSGLIQSSSSMSKEEITAYNAPFQQYEGNISGTLARDLCDKVRDHNNSKLDDSTQQIKVVAGTASGETSAPTTNVLVSDITAVKKLLKTGKRYTVDFGYDSTTGFIIAVGISDLNATTLK